MTAFNAVCGDLDIIFGLSRCEDFAAFVIFHPAYPQNFFVRCNAHAVAFVGEASEWAIAPIEEAAGMQARMIDHKAQSSEDMAYTTAYQTAYDAAYDAIDNAFTTYTTAIYEAESIAYYACNHTAAASAASAAALMAFKLVHKLTEPQREVDDNRPRRDMRCT